MITSTLTSQTHRSVHMITNPLPDEEELSEIMALMRFTKRGMCAVEISEANFLPLQKAIAHLQELMTHGTIVRVLREGVLMYELA